jgi:hypothetical protein
VSSFFYAKICSLLARRRSSQPVQRVYWPENVIDWLGKWRPTCVIRHARGQKLQSFRRKWPFYMDLYSMLQPNMCIFNLYMASSMFLICTWLQADPGICAKQWCRRGRGLSPLVKNVTCRLGRLISQYFSISHIHNLESSLQL